MEIERKNGPPTAGGGEWDVFNVSTTNGGPLAGNLNAYWSLGRGMDISRPSLFDATTLWWTVNGVAVSPIYPFGGICCPGANAVNPAWGEAYHHTFAGQPVDGFVTYNPAIDVSPYNFISQGGMNPDTVNGFDFAFHFDPQQPTSEPASMLLFGSGVLGIAGVLRRRRLR